MVDLFLQHIAAHSTSGTPGSIPPLYNKMSMLDAFVREQESVIRKLNQKDCIIYALKAKKELWLLQDSSNRKERDYTLALGNVQGQLGTLKKEKEILQRKLDGTEARLRATTAHTNLPLNNAVKETVESKTKNIVWGMVKFIQNKEDMYNAAKLLVKYGQLDRHHVETKSKRADFIETYKTTVRKAIFQRRNYVAAEHKKVIVKQYKDKKVIPTVEQLLKCLQRDISTDEDFEIFEFYWEELLPKQVGSLNWSKEVRRYETICEAMRREDDGPRLPLITAQDEAFTVLVIQNSLSRWITDLKEKEQARRDRQAGILPPKPPDDPAEEEKPAEKKKPPSGLFTTTEAGQNEWGGWSQKGLDLYHRYVELNMSARKNRNTRTVEHTCLGNIKRRHSISCKDHKSQIDFARRCKRKRATEQQETLPIGSGIQGDLFDFDTDDEELYLSNQGDDSSKYSCGTLFLSTAHHQLILLSLVVLLL